MSVKRLPREMGMWIRCDGTDDEGCKEQNKVFSATIMAGYNRDWFQKSEGWGRGLRTGYKRRDLCPACLAVERKLLDEQTAKTEAWKKQRAENRKAKWAEQQAAKPPKKPRKKKASTAVSAGAVTEAEEASIGQPEMPSPSAA